MGQHNKYDRSQSSTYVENGTFVNLTFLSGNVNGYLSTDDFYIGGHRVLGQTFIETKEIGGDHRSAAKFDGIFGLAFGALSVNEVTPPFITMLEQLVVPKGMFSVYLSSDTDVHPGGEIMFGGWDEQYFNPSNIHWINLTDLVYWQFKVDRISVGDYETCNACDAFADTGSSMIVGPREPIMEIIKTIGATYYEDHKMAYIECNKVNSLPTVEFVIGGKIYSVEPVDYLLLISEQTPYCMVGFKPVDNYDAFWILGDVFLAKYYTIFNMDDETISFNDYK